MAGLPTTLVDGFAGLAYNLLPFDGPFPISTKSTLGRSKSGPVSYVKPFWVKLTMLGNSDWLYRSRRFQETNWGLRSNLILQRELELDRTFWAKNCSTPVLEGGRGNRFHPCLFFALSSRELSKWRSTKKLQVGGVDTKGPLSFCG